MTPSQYPGNVLDVLRDAAEEQTPEPDYSDLDLRDVTDRLRTYSNWPSRLPTKEDLAEAGFYFTGKHDIVRCAYCQVEVGQWEPRDNPELEHRKYSSPSKCLYLKWCKTTTPENNVLYDDGVGDTCGPYGVDGVKEALLKHDKLTRSAMGDSYHNATFVSVYENYVYYSERLKTFDDWPSDSKISKEALSEAGFIYRHDSDHTCCFHCSGALRKWEVNDDPWEEHAGWFPDCKYVLTMKGQKFIDTARVRRLNINSVREVNSDKEIGSDANT